MKINIGENIKRLRMKKQITQEQLAVAMGVSSAAVSKWERENTLPDVSLLPLLANYFGVSIDELMGYDAARIENEIDRCETNFLKLETLRNIPGFLKKHIRSTPTIIVL